MKMKVKKALTPEEKTLIANVKSMLSELEAMEGGQMTDEADGAMSDINSMAGTASASQGEPGMGTPPDAGESEPAPSRPEDIEENEVMRSEQGDSEGATASDDAEDRLKDDLPEDDKSNIKSVSKTLARLAKAAGYSLVKKSDPNIDLAIAVTKLAENQIVMKSAMERLLTDLGVANAITERETVEKANQSQRRPVGATDADAIMGVFKQLLTQQSGQPAVHSAPEAQAEVRKNLGIAMQSLFGR